MLEAHCLEPINAQMMGIITLVLANYLSMPPKIVHLSLSMLT